MAFLREETALQSILGTGIEGKVMGEKLRCQLVSYFVALSCLTAQKSKLWETP
jgi:hypothetical protein